MITTQSGRYFVYRPPRTVSHLPSTLVVAGRRVSRRATSCRNARASGRILPGAESDRNGLEVVWLAACILGSWPAFATQAAACPCCGRVQPRGTEVGRQARRPPVGAPARQAGRYICGSWTASFGTEADSWPGIAIVAARPPWTVFHLPSALIVGSTASRHAWPELRSTPAASLQRRRNGESSLRIGGVLRSLGQWRSSRTETALRPASSSPRLVPAVASRSRRSAKLASLCSLLQQGGGAGVSVRHYRPGCDVAGSREPCCQTFLQRRSQSLSDSDSLPNNRSRVLRSPF
ncbi:hypothetical protein GQ55_1G413400 [Panicum hallii var. hallii]|uniref:Uncharacterized protein n=1 Tax=Panicum hallii var. hallii TaxID=1504633 RepID=A0A2T7FCZ0_9POAL|nr:hypothetical protein GQ55_1G413400 [Panicum hallii var. hallii]